MSAFDATCEPPEKTISGAVNSCPIFDSQVGNEAEILEVSRDKKRAKRSSNRGDFQVHGSKFDSQTFQPLEMLSSRFVEIENLLFRVPMQHLPKAGIALDL